jgi:regulator of sirC expression with transglutaminase-like and TPR domain
MIDPQEINNLIYLLDDPDQEIFEQISGRILSLGSKVIPYLEDAIETQTDTTQLERLRYLSHELKRSLRIDELRAWAQDDENDLLDGLMIINQIEYPEVERVEIDRMLEKIKLDAWLELNYDLSSFEQIKILNYVFYELHQFKGNTTEYHHVDNNFISKVLENKKGNPVSLSIVYAMIAQRLNIPVYGVNLPQHFVLGYRSSEGIELLKRFNDPTSLSKDNQGDILFYINPFSDGLVLSYESLKNFLEELKIEPRPEYFTTCSNVDIIRRVLRNLMFSYEKAENHSKRALVEEMLQSIA